MTKPPIRVRVQVGRPRRRIVIALVAAAAVALLATALVLPAIGGRGTAPLASRDAAEQALARASEAGAARFAAERHAAAVAAVRAARMEFRRQEVRFWSLRDFRAARAAFRDAESIADAALDEALRERDRIEDRVRCAVRAARCAVDRTAALADDLRFDPEVHTTVGIARVRAGEAEILEHEGRHELALDRAAEADIAARDARARMGLALGRYADPEAIRDWRADRDRTIQWSAKNRGAAIVVNKDRAEVTLYHSGRPVRTYVAEFGRNPLPRKLRAHDHATPEGTYRVIHKKGPGATRYHRALEIDYPNRTDRERLAREIAAGRLRAGTSPGGLIEIHGHGGQGRDWTEGCVSLSNADMDELFARVAEGTPVAIVGADGSPGRYSTLARMLAEGVVERDCACH